MHSVQLNKSINQIISIFHRLGLWHQGEEPTVREKRLKIFYSIYYLLFPISLICGAFKNDSPDASIFLMESAIITSVFLLKLFYIIWKKKEILELLNPICVYSIDDSEEFTLVDKLFKRFTKSVHFLLVPSYVAAAIGSLVVPFVGDEKTLFFDIGFPMDWKNNEIAYWMAFIFLTIQNFYTTIILLFSVIIWYLMMNCTSKYNILGSQIRKMGQMNMIETTGKKNKVSKLEKANAFLERLIKAIKFNHRIREEIEQMESFLSPIFLTQVVTSALCICGSIYSLIFSISENSMEYMVYVGILFYNLFEIFMVMYFGNEIKLSSDRLTYCLFESDWTDQPQSTKKSLIIFCEILQQPYVLVVARLYTLTLETFTSILNSAYSMFNILKDMK